MRGLYSMRGIYSMRGANNSMKGAIQYEGC